MHFLKGVSERDGRRVTPSPLAWIIGWIIYKIRILGWGSRLEWRGGNGGKEVMHFLTEMSDFHVMIPSNYWPWVNYWTLSLQSGLDWIYMLEALWRPKEWQHWRRRERQQQSKKGIEEKKGKEVLEKEMLSYSNTQEGQIRVEKILC